MLSGSFPALHTHRENATYAGLAAVTRTLHFGLGAHHTWTFDGRYFDPRRADVIRVAFGGHPGRYVFHCHNLEHEDMAMMGTMLVR
jgi:hypothetical protein